MPEENAHASHLLVALMLVAVTSAIAAPVVGFLRVDTATYFAEEQRYRLYATRVPARAGNDVALKIDPEEEHC